MQFLVGNNVYVNITYLARTKGCSGVIEHFVFPFGGKKDLSVER